MTISAYDLSRQASMPLSVRMPRDLVQRLNEAAEASGVDRSAYVRDALAGALSITWAATTKIQSEAVLAERRRSAAELQVVREELGHALEETSRARDRIAELEQEFDPPWVRVLVLSDRILKGQPAARDAFAELWQNLDPAAKAELVPVVHRAIRSSFFAVGDASNQRLDDREWERKLLTEAAWLMGQLLDALSARPPVPLPDPDSPAPVVRDREDAAPAIGVAPPPAFDAGEPELTGSLASSSRDPEMEASSPTVAFGEGDYFEVVTGGDFSGVVSLHSPVPNAASRHLTVASLKAAALRQIAQTSRVD